ncbi:MAG: hypothetical protein VXW65_12925 [Pseudomonadota bacterium]|nr:hypothetical protein [Pseudomonadota bacterium]
MLLSAWVMSTVWQVAVWVAIPLGFVLGWALVMTVSLLWTEHDQRHRSKHVSDD